MKEEVIAEKLAKDMKEISVAEFFEKNRHFLGYENPTKSLITVVKEAVDNSIAWDMPTVIKTNGAIRVVRIGQFIDEQFSKYKEFIIKERDENLEKLKFFDRTKVLCFDKNTQKIKFKDIRVLFRHKVNSDIVRITLNGGRYVDVTEFHSIFALKEGKPVSIKTTDLKEGDYLIVPGSNWGGNQFIGEIEIFEEFLKLPKELTKNIRVYEVREVLDKELEDSIRKILSKGKFYRLNDFKKCNSIPFNLIRRLTQNQLKKFKNCEIGFKFSKYKLPPKLPITEHLVEFLGFYVAEGSVLHNLHKVYLSFGKDEEELIDYVSNLIKLVWNIEPSINNAHPTAKNLVIHSKNIAFFIKHVINAGCKAGEKRVPSIIFNLLDRLREMFLLAYMSGDGYPVSKIFKVLKEKGRIQEIDSKVLTLATISKELSSDLQYLLSSLEFTYSYAEGCKENRIINRRQTSFSRPYILYISPKQVKPTTYKVPIFEVAENITGRLEHFTKKYGQKDIFIPTLLRTLTNGGLKLKEGAGTFLNGDLGALKIKKIEKIRYDKKFVYDLSVPEHENFVAGSGPIFCHNSLEFTTEARILPDIKLTVKQVGVDRFKVTVEDNGPGIVEEQVPKAFARVLYGSRFHVLKQSRSLFGIGIKGACLYAQLTTGKPIKVASGIGKGPLHVFELMINVTKNEPIVISHSKEKNPEKWHGIKIEMEVEGRYVERAQSIPEYLKQTAMANPYAHIVFDGPSGKVEFKRTVDKLPRQPKEIKPHPYGVELGILRRMLRATKARNILAFLMKDFSRVGKRSAEQICKLAKIEFNKNPKTLTSEESDRLHKAMQMVKLIAPPTNCLSPLEETLIIQGLKKELNAEFYVASTRPPAVYRGYPFQISVGLAYGGGLSPSQTCQLFRFANKVPLLYHQGDCAITRAASEVDWRRYGLSQSTGALPVGPLAILVHFASVWVPFTTEGKQAIANYPEIVKEAKLALQDAGRKLAKFIRQRRKARERFLRRQLFERYIPEVAQALAKLTDKNQKVILNKLEEMIKKKAEVKA